MTLLERIAPLFAYPDSGYAARAAESARLLDLEPIRAFAEAIADTPTAELQERFTEAFDLDPDCAPELGWHLFGERYERGEWLADLRADQRRLGLEASVELPDHLTNMMKMLARLAREEPSRADALARTIAPAIDQLHAALVRRGSPYHHVMTAVRQVTAPSKGNGDD